MLKTDRNDGLFNYLNVRIYADIIKT